MGLLDSIQKGVDSVNKASNTVSNAANTVQKADRAFDDTKSAAKTGGKLAGNPWFWAVVLLALVVGFYAFTLLYSNPGLAK